MSVAKETPDIKYIIVTGKDDIKNKKMEYNIQYYQELPVKEYYKLMKNAFITICPLKENKVSGLINLIKSIQYGVPCIATDLDVTSIYYPDEMKKVLLYSRNDKENLKNIILECCSFSEEQYVIITRRLQKQLKDNFSPEQNVEKLIQELKRRNL